MMTSQNILKAGRIVRSGGVIAYPTEGVYGLGCLPDDFEAVARILTMKERDPDMGLVLIISDIEQLEDWIDAPLNALTLESSLETPVTWILPATEEAPWWICGKHSGIAVRKTAHPVARALCQATDSALVSTSANISGRPPARTAHVLRRIFGALVDYIVPGACGPASGPSEIRVYESGKVLRTS